MHLLLVLQKLVLLIWVYELKLCVVKPPKCEHNGKAIMQDLAVFTGGEVGSIGS